MLETLSDDDYVNVVSVSIIRLPTCWMLGGLFIEGDGGGGCQNLHPIRIHSHTSLHIHNKCPYTDTHIYTQIKERQRDGWPVTKYGFLSGLATMKQAFNEIPTALFGVQD